MNILVISNTYPSRTLPSFGAFVYNLMQELAIHHEITIIAPYKIHDIFKRTQKSYGNEKCKVLRPLYLSLSSRTFLGINTGKISSYFFEKAVKRELNKLSIMPDVIYTHFLSNAIPALAFKKRNNIPLVIASGESTYRSWVDTPEPIKNEIKKSVNHIICVSNDNRIRLMDLGFNENKMTVIPNAVNYSLFKPLDKIKCKEKLGLAKDQFVIGFIGHFIHRKGPNRIIEAIEFLDDTDIRLVCIGGKGDLKPNSFTTVIGPVPNYQLPELYNAFDIFVLPTLYEGHCNVIEEAKACGIPIISSKGTSVAEQIDESTGVLVDPLDIKKITMAISNLKSDIKFREELIDNLLRKRGESSLEVRARKISQILIDTFSN
ncbi:glycosyltransferase [Aequorivita marisscotiae]|uniref:Glycosyltransferase n=1 Tax=Aequorivita marisscotiae TaxID=3040348 RepID=A0ABY8KTA0_9FLAO|nr:glycosyltransferase [Aequorivita sp. Ant34-E75]WGF92213.1 glycosyltransferase [Aequorivita sp. Ant34-E75]